MFLEDIRKDWSLQRDQMNQRIQEAEEKAIEEVKETFAEVKKDIDNSAGEKTTQKVELIERLISGEERLYGVPLYRILYDELKQLFQILLEAGYVDLCKKHAKLMTHQIYLPKDLNQGEKWALTLKNGRTSKILTAEELEVARRDNEGSLLSTPPDYSLTDEIYIEEFSFAPSVIEAYAALDAVHWERLRDPAIVWWYFESALKCWKTTEFYFDEILRPKNGNDLEKHFRTTCEKATWRELASVRDRDNLTTPVIFTDNFFRAGLRTLINAINIFLSQDPVLLKRQSKREAHSDTIFELVLDGNELWVNVTFENQEAERFFIQKFQEGPSLNGSCLHQFLQDIFIDPEAGEKKAKFDNEWESASKHINRIHLPKFLKSRFFLKSHGSCFHFGGTRISLKSDKQEEIRSILKELRKNQLKSNWI